MTDEVAHSKNGEEEEEVLGLAQNMASLGENVAQLDAKKRWSVDKNEDESSNALIRRASSSVGFWTKVWRSFVGVARPPSVLARLSLGERSRALLDESTLRILHNSFRLAEESLHAVVRHEHLLRLLLEHPDVHRLVTDIGVDVDELVVQIQTEVAKLPSVQGGEVIALAAPSLLRAVHRAMVFVLGTQKEKAVPVDLFLAVLAEIEPELHLLLQKMGCERFLAVVFLSHGVLEHQLELSGLADDSVRILMHNDSYTTQEWVVYILHEKFKLDAAEARGVMLEIHNHGQTTVTNMPKEKAIGLVKEILEESRKAGMPLKMSIIAAY